MSFVPLWDDDFVFGDVSGKGYWNDNDDDDWDHEFENENLNSDSERTVTTLPVRLSLTRKGSLDGMAMSSSTNALPISLLDYLASCSTAAVMKKPRNVSRFTKYTDLPSVLDNIDKISPGFTDSRYQYLNRKASTQFDVMSSACFVNLKASLHQYNLSSASDADTNLRKKSRADCQGNIHDDDKLKHRNILSDSRITFNKRTAKVSDPIQTENCIIGIFSSLNISLNLLESMPEEFPIENLDSVAQFCEMLLESECLGFACVMDPLRSLRAQVVLTILNLHLQMLISYNDDESTDIHGLLQVMSTLKTSDQALMLRRDSNWKYLVEELEATCVASVLFLIAKRSPITSEYLSKVANYKNCNKSNTISSLTSQSTTTSSYPIKNHHRRKSSRVHWLSCGLASAGHSRNSSATSADCLTISFPRLHEIDARTLAISSPSPWLPLKDAEITRKSKQSDNIPLPLAMIIDLTLELLGAMHSGRARSRLLHATASFLLACSQNSLSTMFDAGEAKEQSERLIKALSGTSEVDIMSKLLHQAVRDYFCCPTSLWTMDLSCPIPSASQGDGFTPVPGTRGFNDRQAAGCEISGDLSGLTLSSHHVCIEAGQLLRDLGNSVLEACPNRALLVLEACLALLTCLRRVDEAKKLEAQLAGLAALVGDCSRARTHLSHLLILNGVEFVEEMCYSSDLLLHCFCDRGRVLEGTQEIYKVVEFLKLRECSISSPVDARRFQAASDSLILKLALTHLTTGKMQSGIMSLQFLLRCLSLRFVSIVTVHKTIAVLSHLAKAHLMLEDCDSVDDILSTIRTLRENSGLSSGICSQQLKPSFHHCNSSCKVSITDKPPPAGCRSDPLPPDLPRFGVTKAHLDLGELTAALHLKRGNYVAALEALYPTLLAVEVIVMSDERHQRPRSGLIELTRLYQLKAQILYEASLSKNSVKVPFRVGTYVLQNSVEEALSGLLGIQLAKSHARVPTTEAPGAPRYGYSLSQPSCSGTVIYSSRTDLANAAVKCFRCAWSLSRLVGDELTAAEAATGVVDVQLSALFSIDNILESNQSSSTGESMNISEHIVNSCHATKNMPESLATTCLTDFETKSIKNDDFCSETVEGDDDSTSDGFSDPVITGFDIVTRTEDDFSLSSKEYCISRPALSTHARAGKVAEDREKLLSDTFRISNQVLKCASYADIPFPLIKAQLMLAENLLLMGQWEKLLQAFTSGRDLFLHLFVVSFAHNEISDEYHREAPLFGAYCMGSSDSELAAKHVIDIPLMRIAPLGIALMMHSLLSRMIRLMWTISLYSQKQLSRNSNEACRNSLDSDAAGGSDLKVSSSFLQQNLLLVDVYLTSAAELHRARCLAISVSKGCRNSLADLLSAVRSTRPVNLPSQNRSRCDSAAASQASSKSQDRQSWALFSWNNSCLQADCVDPGSSNIPSADMLQLALSAKTQHKLWKEHTSNDDADLEPALPLIRAKVLTESDYFYTNSALSTATCMTPEDTIFTCASRTGHLRTHSPYQSSGKSINAQRSASESIKTAVQPAGQDSTKDLVICSVKDMQKLAKHSWRCMLLWQRSHHRYLGQHGTSVKVGPAKGAGDPRYNLRSMQVETRRAVRALSLLMKRHRISIACKLMLSYSSGSSEDAISYTSGVSTAAALDASVDSVPQAMQMFPIKPILYKLFESYKVTSMHGVSASESREMMGIPSSDDLFLPTCPDAVPGDYWIKVSSDKSPRRAGVAAYRSSDMDLGSHGSGLPPTRFGRRDLGKDRYPCVIIALQVPFLHYFAYSYFQIVAIKVENVIHLAHPASGRMITSPLKDSLSTGARARSLVEMFLRGVVDFVQRSHFPQDFEGIYGDDRFKIGVEDVDHDALSRKQRMNQSHTSPPANSRSCGQCANTFCEPVDAADPSVCKVIVVCEESADISQIGNICTQISRNLRLARCHRLVDIAFDDAILNLSI